MTERKIVIDYDGRNFTVELDWGTGSGTINMCNSPRYDDAISAAETAFNNFGGKIPVIDNVARAGR